MNEERRKKNGRGRSFTCEWVDGGITYRMPCLTYMKMRKTTLRNYFLFSTIFVSCIASFSCTKENPTQPAAPVPTYADYFPLHVGNRWTYYHTYSHYDGMSDYSDWSWGVLTWTIVSVDSSPQRVAYTFQAYREDSASYIWKGIQGKTTFSSGPGAVFVVEEDAAHRLTIPDSILYNWADAFRVNEIFRRQLPTAPDTLSFNGVSASSQVLLKRSLGIVQALWAIRGIGHYADFMKLVGAEIYGQ